MRCSRQISQILYTCASRASHAAAPRHFLLAQSMIHRSLDMELQRNGGVCTGATCGSVVLCRSCTLQPCILCKAGTMPTVYVSLRCPEFWWPAQQWMPILHIWMLLDWLLSDVSPSFILINIFCQRPGCMFWWLLFALTFHANHCMLLALFLPHIDCFSPSSIAVSSSTKNQKRIVHVFT